MVTKADLDADTEQLAREKKARELKAEKDHEQWLVEREARDLERAKELVKGELGKFIREMNKKGHKKLRVGQHRTWRPNTRDGWVENYGAPFVLDFQPKPEYAPTKALVSSLRRAGFSVEHTDQRHAIRNTYITADGYDFGPVIGYETRHYLVIRW